MLDTDTESAVAIVGGGIAGIATAFFTLRDTTEPVVRLETGRIADGASGYNAGQLVTYFEKPIGALVDDYGVDLALEAQRGSAAQLRLQRRRASALRLWRPANRKADCRRESAA